MKQNRESEIPLIIPNTELKPKMKSKLKFTNPIMNRLKSQNGSEKEGDINPLDADDTRNFTPLKDAGKKSEYVSEKDNLEALRTENQSNYSSPWIKQMNNSNFKTDENNSRRPILFKKFDLIKR